MLIGKDTQDIVCIQMLFPDPQGSLIPNQVFPTQRTKADHLGCPGATVCGSETPAT